MIILGMSISDIYHDLLSEEESNSSRIVSPAKICVNTPPCRSNSNQNWSINTLVVQDSHDQYILNLLEDLTL